MITYNSKINGGLFIQGGKWLCILIILSVSYSVSFGQTRQFAFLPIGTNLSMPGYPGVTYSITYGEDDGSEGLSDTNSWTTESITKKAVYIEGADNSRAHNNGGGNGLFIEVTFSQPIPVEGFGFIGMDLDGPNDNSQGTILSGTASPSDFELYNTNNRFNQASYNTVTGEVTIPTVNTGPNNFYGFGPSPVILGSEGAIGTIQSYRVESISGAASGIVYGFLVNRCWMNPCNIYCDPCASTCGASGIVTNSDRYGQFFNPGGTTLTIPDGVSEIFVQAWGAGGGLEFDGSHGGAGGYSEGRINVSPGDEFRIVAGEGGRGGYVDSVDGSTSYDAAGMGGADRLDGGGGGLSGIFTNNFSRADALIMAGGGGGAVSNFSHGRNGNAPSAGGMPSMKGFDDTNWMSLSPVWRIEEVASGGGGYNGGSVLLVDPTSGTERYTGLGGTGYTHPTLVTDGSIDFTPDGNHLPPNTGDPNYFGVAGQGASGGDGERGGNGIVVITMERNCCNDASMTIRNVDDSNCPGGNITIDVKILNGPDSPIAMGTPISFYDGDPSVSNAPLLHIHSLSNPIQNGATEIIQDINVGTCDILNTEQLIYAVLGDNGTTSRPFNLVDLQSTGYNDCTMEDNMSAIKQRKNCIEYDQIIKN